MDIPITVALIGFVGTLITVYITLIWNIYKLYEVNSNQLKLIEHQSNLNEQVNKRGVYNEWIMSIISDFLNWLQEGYSLAIQVSYLNQSIPEYEGTLNDPDQNQETIRNFILELEAERLSLHDELLKWYRLSTFYDMVLPNIDTFSESDISNQISRISNSIAASMQLGSEEFSNTQIPIIGEAYPKIMKIFDQLFPNKQFTNSS